jgi:hypothetical protein
MTLEEKQREMRYRMEARKRNPLKLKGFMLSGNRGRYRAVKQKYVKVRHSAPVDLGHACSIAAKIVSELPNPNPAFVAALKEASRRLEGQTFRYVEKATDAPLSV